MGNPGREYARNRHNAGYLVVDELARRHDGSWKSKFSGQLAEIKVGDEKLILLKPETYMNDSGRSVGAAAAFFKVEPEDVLIVHVGSSRVDLQACKLEYSIVSPK